MTPYRLLMVSLGSVRSTQDIQTPQDSLESLQDCLGLIKTPWSILWIPWEPLGLKNTFGIFRATYSPLVPHQIPITIALGSLETIQTPYGLLIISYAHLRPPNIPSEPHRTPLDPTGPSRTLFDPLGIAKTQQNLLGPLLTLSIPKNSLEPFRTQISYTEAYRGSQKFMGTPRCSLSASQCHWSTPNASGA